MNALESLLINCPYCGENIDISIDCSVDQQEYTEDCSVCCRPITLNVICEAGNLSVQAWRDDDC